MTMNTDTSTINMTTNTDMAMDIVTSTDMNIHILTRTIMGTSTHQPITDISISRFPMMMSNTNKLFIRGSSTDVPPNKA